MFEPMRYARTTKIIINREQKQSNLIFLKSNYKYKRRCAIAQPETEMSALSNKFENEMAKTQMSVRVKRHQQQQQQEQQQQRESKDQNEQNIISTIQNLLIIITTKMMQLLLAMHEAGKRQNLMKKSSSILLADNNDIIQRCADSVGNDKLSTQRRRPHNVANSSHQLVKTTRTTATRAAAAKTACRSTTTATTTKTLSLRILSILMSLFIAAILNVRRVEAGACWQTTLENGKCNEIFSLNITKSECCVSNPEFSYTNRELTSVEYFFATAIGGGMECAPCRESCKNMMCGANKKCVKRKGRPKCICAPECGAAMRRRQQQQQQQQQQKQKHQHHQQQQQHHNELNQKRTHSAKMHEQAKLLMNADDEGAEKSARDIRSLSSEITNINLDLDSAKRHHSSNHQQQQQHSHFYHQQQEQHEQDEQQNNKNNNNDNNNNNNSNQRKLHLQQSSSQRSQEKPQTAQSLMKRESFKPRRLLITSNVQQQTEKPTTRRIQIMSNVEMPPYPNDDSYSNSNSNNNYNHNNNNNDDLSRSSTMSILNAHIRHDAQSRHKAITNEPNEFSRKKYRQRGRNHNKNTKQHNNDNISKVEHVHQQNIRPVEYTTNHEDLEQQQQQHQQQRKRKHRQRKNNKNNNNNNSSSTSIGSSSSSNNMNNNQHRQKPKDHNAVTVNATTTTTTKTGKDMSTVAEKSGTLQTTPTTKATTTILTSTLATPLHSTVSGERHFLNSMNNEHGSKIATSSATSSSSATAVLTSVGSNNNEGVPQQQQQQNNEAVGGVASISNSVNADDLAFIDRFYDQFSQHGFPTQQQFNTMDNLMPHSHPVCGTDGRTYNTECQLKKRACRTNNQQLQVAYRGHCRTSCNGVKCLNGLTCVEDQYMIPHCIACKIDCPRDDDDDDNDDDVGNDDHAGVYDLDTVDSTDDDEMSNIGIGNFGVGRGIAYVRRKTVIEAQRAVCGIDGKTYKSTCDINRMICKIGRAIAVAYPGPCRADRVTCEDINCGPKHTCLTDLLSHEPRCVSCRYKCVRKRHPDRFEDGKICGVNNRTYNSWCEMRKDSCSTGFYIDVKSSGACQ